MICKYCKYFSSCGDLSRTESCNGKEIGINFFREIAKYANENWAKGSFTKEEVEEYAEIYYADLQWSKENETIGASIKSLCKSLAEDLQNMPDLAEPREWLNEIADELSLVDMDWQDYTETDEWLYQ